MILLSLTESIAKYLPFSMRRLITFALPVVVAVGASACAQTAPPVAVSVTMVDAAPASPAKVAVRNLHIHSDDMDAMITKRTPRGELAGLRVWRDNGMMNVTFQITNNQSTPLRLLAVENWTEKSGKPIDRRMDEQTIVVPASWTQTVTLIAPIPQARNLVLELIAGR